MRVGHITAMRRVPLPMAKSRRETNKGCAAGIWADYRKRPWCWLESPADIRKWCYHGEIRLSYIAPNNLTLCDRHKKADLMKTNEYRAEKWYPDCPRWHWWNGWYAHIVNAFDIEVRRVHRGCGRRVHTCAF